MPRIPLPRRGIRSLFILTVLVLGPYMVLRSLSDIADDEYEGGSGLGFGVFGGGSGSGALGGRYIPGISETRRKVNKNRSKGRTTNSQGRTSGQSKSGKGAAGKTRAKKDGLAEHRWDANGLVYVNPNGRHPIYDLIERAKETWEEKLDKSSKTLREAVNEYRRRYGRPPPKGFDRWWRFAQDYNVKLPDEYDQIFKDLEPFYAMTPQQLNALTAAASSKSGMITIYCPGSANGGGPCVYDIEKAGLNEEGTRVAGQRAEGQLRLLREIESDLEEVTMVMYSHDVPWQFVGHEYKGALEDAASVGEYYDISGHQLDWAHLGWASACAPHKPLRQNYDHQVLPNLDKLWSAKEKTFIWDHKASMDPCMHPRHTHLTGFLSSHGKGPGPKKELFPVLAICKTPLHSDVLAVSEEGWTEDVGEDPPWEEKKDERMLWRGTNTGISFRPQNPWQISQRVNLLERTNAEKGHNPVLYVTSETSPVGPPDDISLAELNADLVDVAFVDQPIQCDKAICDIVRTTMRYASRKDNSASNQYKYLLDIDGNGWSARFKRLMTTNSVVIKSTIFPEWYTDRVQPWVHYVPVKEDLTDLYDVLSFFRNGHDDLAKEIAVEGKKWSKTFWRREDMMAYQYRLFLELARLQAPDRQAASYLKMGNDIDG